MASQAGSEELIREATPSVHRLREHALEGARPQIGELWIQASEGPALSCSVVVIGELEGAFLVAVPQTASEVFAASLEDPAEARPGVTLKVWLGMLQQSLEDSVDFAVDGELAPDVPFLGFGSRSQERLDPFGPSLSAIASEHFAFLTPVEDAVRGRGEGSDGGEVSWEQRLTRLESGMLRVQESCRPCWMGLP